MNGRIKKNKLHLCIVIILCICLINLGQGMGFRSNVFAETTSGSTAESAEASGDTATSSTSESAASATSGSSAESSSDTGRTEADKLEQLSGKTAGVTTGTPQDQLVREQIKDAKIQYFNNVTDLGLALKTHKVDYITVSTVNYQGLAKEYPEFGYLNVTLATYKVSTIFAKTEKGETLRKELNEYIAKIKGNGVLEELQDFWLVKQDVRAVDIPKSGKNGVIKMATPNTFYPFSYMQNDKNVGFDIEVIAGFCREYGYGLNIDNAEFSGALSGIMTKKYDLAAGQISWTAERAKSVLYSDSYYTQLLVPVVNSAEYNSPDLVTSDDSSSDAASGGNSSGDQTGNGSVWNSIRRTIVDEDRWISILNGLLVTLVITFGGFLLANLLGALLAVMALSKSRVKQRIAGAYSSLMQGLPMVVILLILYYIIFAHSSISNVVVAVIAFGLVFAAYLAQLFEGGIRGVAKGQWEAALAMGLSKRQAFRGIIFPQAVRTMLPGYFSNLISLMKGTAVVGYIAVTDLTKVGDIIRSSTYEAIVPLLTIALIYFVMACVLLAVMNGIRKRLVARKPRRMHKRCVQSCNEKSFVATDNSKQVSQPASTPQDVEDGKQSNGIPLNNAVSQTQDIKSSDKASNLQDVVQSSGSNHHEGSVQPAEAESRISVLTKSTDKNPDEDSPIISIRHLSKAYGNVVPLRDIDVDIHRGEVISIIGPSGTGKSTLLRCLNRLEEPTSGTVLVDGVDVGAKDCDLRRMRQKMGMVFQSFNLFHHLNVIDNIMYGPLRILGLPEDEAYERGMKLLRTVGLEDKELSYPDELSGGQVQRIAIARTLAMEPEIILFDEPTSALDPTMVGEVVAVIKRLAQEGLTMLIVTHEMRLARSVSSRIFYLDQGIVYEDGTPDQIFYHPEKERTRRFINGLDGIRKTFRKSTLDYLGFLTEINEFALRKMFTPKLLYRVQAVIEEIYLQTMLPVLDNQTDVLFTLDYSDKKNLCEIQFRWSASPINPLPDMDEISRKLAEHAAKDIGYRYTEDGCNEIYITIEE